MSPRRQTRTETAPLTDRQRQILEVIADHLRRHGYPPSVREIGAAVGLSSPSSVHSQLAQLERKGYLRREPTKPRAMEVHRDPDTALPRRPAPTRNVPLLGEIAAGGPIVAEEQVEAVYSLPRELVGEGDVFLLRVRGDSMVGAGIMDGDLVAVRQQPEVASGEICAALIDGEATVKYLRRRGGEVVLEPANPAYGPIHVDRHEDVRILGRVVAVLRRL